MTSSPPPPITTAPWSVSLLKSLEKPSMAPSTMAIGITVKIRSAVVSRFRSRSG